MSQESELMSFTALAEQAITAANDKEFKFFVNKALESAITYEDLSKTFHPDLIREWMPKGCGFASDVTNAFVLKRVHQALKTRWHNDKLRLIYQEFKEEFSNKAFQELTKRGVVIDKERLQSLYAQYLYEETRFMRES